MAELKQAKTYEEQLSILKSRELIIEDDGFALNVLKRISYYRLSGYLVEYKESEQAYKSGTSFQMIYDTYQFDARLRNILLGILEAIEISFRTKLTYHLAISFGPLGYRNSSNFRTKEKSIHEQMIERIDQEIKRSSELFKTHYATKYDGKYPIWVASEMMSFATVSKLYSILPRANRNDISRDGYQIDCSFLESWMRCLVQLRNACAHYSRLYNKQLVFAPKILDEHRSYVPDSNSLFAAIYVAAFLYEPAAEWDSFVTNLASLVERYESVIDVSKMGFPRDWEERLRSLKDD
ncbi:MULTISPECIES: Abi family protein [Alicyclobacillus]|uniref:Abortive infection bacteriophage resistance protein n=1 Tax=Alicyclobacillus tolerans TaxID=90970 RepID=A0ABT9LYL7_9BACL|nr:MULTISPECIES: Abi family protein [Alicyclobacillus]MDP9729362.1 abortive infection bacteriophage resistance protein [Alicyclobacillus tengchongensis]